jgi:hypothetical protein
MKSALRFLALAMAIFTLTAGQALATEQRRGATGKTHTIKTYRVSTHARARLPRPRYQQKSTNGRRVIKTKAYKNLSIARIRSAVIKQTLIDLQELRPYTINFNELKSAVRLYWNRNITRPTTRGLVGTIMPHVKGFYKGFVRGKVRSGAAAGIKKVKLALQIYRKQ